MMVSKLKILLLTLLLNSAFVNVHSQPVKNYGQLRVKETGY